MRAGIITDERVAQWAKLGYSQPREQLNWFVAGMWWDGDEDHAPVSFGMTVKAWKVWEAISVAHREALSAGRYVVWVNEVYITT